MKHPFITIIGNIATGKSTLTTLLAEKLKAEAIMADEFFKHNPFFQDAVGDRSRWSLTSDIWFLIKRAEVATQIETLRQKKPVVQDSGVLMSWVYANSRLADRYMTKNEFKLYEELFSILAKNVTQESTVIVLRLPIQMLLDRIQARGRSFEMKSYTRSYLENLQKSIDERTGKLEQEGKKILRVDQEITDALVADVAQKIT